MMVPLVQTAVTTRGGITTLPNAAEWVRRVWPIALGALRGRVDLGFEGSEAEAELRLIAICAVAFFAHYCEWGSEEWNFNVGLVSCASSGDCTQVTATVQRAAFSDLDAGVRAWVARVEGIAEPWERLRRSSLSFWPRLVAVAGLSSVPFSEALSANNRVAGIVGEPTISGDEETFQRADWDGREASAEGSNPSGTPPPAARTPRAGYAYSATLRREVPNGHCVQSRRDRLWYRAVNGAWVLTQETDSACIERHPLGASGSGGGSSSSSSGSSGSTGMVVLALGAAALWLFSEKNR